MPCTDNINYGSLDSNNEVSASSHENNDSGHEDHCSPFCICLCFGSTISMPTVFEVNTGRMEWSALKQSHYTFDYSFDYNEGIWHPPAIS